MLTANPEEVVLFGILQTSNRRFRFAGGSLESCEISAWYSLCPLPLSEPPRELSRVGAVVALVFGFDRGDFFRACDRAGFAACSPGWQTSDRRSLCGCQRQAANFFRIGALGRCRLGCRLAVRCRRVLPVCAVAGAWFCPRPSRRGRWSRLWPGWRWRGGGGR